MINENMKENKMKKYSRKRKKIIFKRSSNKNNNYKVIKYGSITERKKCPGRRRGQMEGRGKRGRVKGRGEDKGEKWWKEGRIEKGGDNREEK